MIWQVGRSCADKTRHRVNRWRIERLFNRVVTSSKSSLWDEVVLIQISRSCALPVRTSRSPAIVTPDSAHLSTSREDTFGRFASFSCVSVEYTIFVDTNSLSKQRWKGKFAPRVVSDRSWARWWDEQSISTLHAQYTYIYIYMVLVKLDDFPGKYRICNGCLIVDSKDRA